LAKIAVELEKAMAQRAEEGRRGGIAGRVLARGAGWVVEDLVCTCGPRDRAFEEQHQEASIAVVVAGSFQYRSGKACELMTPGTAKVDRPVRRPYVFSKKNQRERGATPAATIW
jgi:AraC family transcriptional regulator